MARAPVPAYQQVAGQQLPELPAGVVTTSMVTLRQLLVTAGLDVARLGSKEWNPLPAWFPPEHGSC